MNKLIIFYIFVLSLLAVKEPILTMPLTLTSEKKLQTTFSLGGSSVRVGVDLNYQEIDVCCKNKKTLAAKIYYFMLNPFRLNEDYRCHAQKNQNAEDVAKFKKIGPLTVKFNQVVYPYCHIGKLGFSKHSNFLSLLPKSQQFYTIQRDPKTNNFDELKLRVGGSYSDNFMFFDKNTDQLWTANFDDVTFNDIPLGNQKIAVTSNNYEMLIPYKPFLFIRAELLRNFECIQVLQVIYCPCNEGVSHSFPLFKLISRQIVVEIKPKSYLMDQDEICKSVIRSTADNHWSVNILMLNSVDVMLQYDTGRVGMAPHRMSIQTSDSINQPLQIILNSVVILLMCLFVAMILIQVIKQVTGIENASTESFQNYMLKHAQE